MARVKRRIRAWLGSLASSSCAKCCQQQLLSITLKDSSMQCQEVSSWVCALFCFKWNTGIRSQVFGPSCDGLNSNVLVFSGSYLWKLLLLSQARRKIFVPESWDCFILTSPPLLRFCVHSQIWNRQSTQVGAWSFLLSQMIPTLRFGLERGWDIWR